MTTYKVWRDSLDWLIQPFGGDVVAVGKLEMIGVVAISHDNLDAPAPHPRHWLDVVGTLTLADGKALIKGPCAPQSGTSRQPA